MHSHPGPITFQSVFRVHIRLPEYQFYQLIWNRRVLITALFLLDCYRIKVHITRKNVLLHSTGRDTVLSTVTKWLIIFVLDLTLTVQEATLSEFIVLFNLCIYYINMLLISRNDIVVTLRFLDSMKACAFGILLILYLLMIQN